MSEMEKRFLESTLPRPAEAKKIPELKTNFFDPTSEFADGFTTFEKQGNPTKFSEKALDYYKAEQKQILIPDGFTPTEEGISLNRWTRDKKYYNPGGDVN
jgi:hypothetical protein